MKRCLLVLLAALPLSAQIRLTGLEGLESKAKSSVEVGLTPEMLKLAAGFLSQSNADDKGKVVATAKSVIDGLKAITVRSFEFAEEGQYKMEDLTAIREQLRAPGWAKVVSVNEPKVTVEIYMQTAQGKVAGLAIIAAEAKELTVVAIEGSIDLAALAQLGGQFGIPNIPNIPIPGLKGKGKEK